MEPTIVTVVLNLFSHQKLTPEATKRSKNLSRMTPKQDKNSYRCLKPISPWPGAGILPQAIEIMLRYAYFMLRYAYCYFDNSMKNYELLDLGEQGLF